MEHCRQLHLERLRKVRPSIDNAPPRTFSHLANNAKAEQQARERYEKIAHENNILLEKLSKISEQDYAACARPTLYRASLSTKPGITFDPSGRPMVDNVYVPPASCTGSLKSDQARRELNRIAEENMALWHRIQARKPFYSVKEFEKQYEQHEEISRRLKESNESGRPRSAYGSYSKAKDVYSKGLRSRPSSTPVQHRKDRPVPVPMSRPTSARPPKAGGAVKIPGRPMSAGPTRAGAPQGAYDGERREYYRPR